MVEALRGVWHGRPAMARRVRQRISTVMEWTVALNYRDDNPCSRIGPVLGPQQDLVQHMRALPHQDVAAVVETVRASCAAPVVKLGKRMNDMTLSVLLCSRPWRFPPLPTASARAFGTGPPRRGTTRARWTAQRMR